MHFFIIPLHSLGIVIHCRAIANKRWFCHFYSFQQTNFVLILVPVLKLED